MNVQACSGEGASSSSGEVQCVHRGAWGLDTEALPQFEGGPFVIWIRVRHYKPEAPEILMPMILFTKLGTDNSQ